MGRRLGQHFLTDQTTLKKIAGFLNIDKNDTVIEIGAGHGELTLEIKNQSASWRTKIKDNPIKIIAIEKDEELAKNLGLRIKNEGLENIEIIHGDALKTLPSLVRNLKLEIRDSNYKVVGNIPYYITGYLLRILGELGNKPSLIVLTIQKEVAERICAEPPQMNLLAASIQFWAEPKLEMIIKRGLFNPPPKVDSAVIRLVAKEPSIKAEIYYPFIKILFKQPRKTVLNNISTGLNMPKTEVEKILVQTEISPSLRPQALKISDITSLARVFET